MEPCSAVEEAPTHSMGPPTTGSSLHRSHISEAAPAASRDCLPRIRFSMSPPRVRRVQTQPPTPGFRIPLLRPAPSTSADDPWDVLMPEDPPLDGIIVTLEEEEPTPEDVQPIPDLGPYRPQSGGPFSPGRARGCASLINEAEALERRVRHARKRFQTHFGQPTPPELPCAGVMRSMLMEATRFREMAELVAGAQKASPPHHSAHR